MVTDRQSMIHVSGHPGRPELQALYEWLKPEVLVPVHGEIRHMQEQARLGLADGIPHAIFQKNGDIVSLAPGEPGKVAKVPTGRLVLDGDIIVPADGGAITDRRRLARDGVLIVVLTGKEDITIRALGIPLDEDFDDFVAEATSDAQSALRRLRGRAARDPAARQEAVRLATRRAATRWSGKRPQVQVVIPAALAVRAAVIAAGRTASWVLNWEYGWVTLDAFDFLQPPSQRG